MELKSLHCPNCNASLEIEDGLDQFFCVYCGHKIFLEGQSAAAYEAKVRVKSMEHSERLQDKKNAQERFKLELEQKSNVRSSRVGLMIFVILAIIWSLIMIIGSNGADRQDQELQAVVDQIMIDIENENFASAYVKASSLYWESDWTSEGEEKWDAIREEVFKQIELAEIKATGSSTRKTTDKSSGGFGNWFD